MYNLSVGLGNTNTSVNSKDPFTIINVIENRRGGTGTADRRRITSDNGSLISRVISSGNTSNSVSSTLGSVYSLPLPETIGMTFRQDWGGDETSAMQQTIAKGISGDLSDMSSLGKAMADFGINMAVGRAARGLFKKASLDKGLAYNPLKELFYNGVDFRTFSFRWKLTPLTRADAVAIDELIYRLAYHSSPDIVSNVSLTSSGLSVTGGGGPSTSAFIIPDTFELEFVNTKIPKMKSIAVTGFDTDYTAAGTPKVLVDGSMQFVTIQLDFIETALITKQEVNRLFSRDASGQTQGAR